VKTSIHLGLALLALMLTACGSVTWVNDVSTTPDGSRVDVVGAQFEKQVFGPPEFATPIRWICLRAVDGHLACREDASVLPQME
jgi:hypothetical protein